MHVTRVELENIKSYTSAEFTFERGTTAIVGRNGAGKTTILEAIAWTLFDHLDYSKDDFLRRGTKKGSVRVTFESDWISANTPCIAIRELSTTSSTQFWARASPRKNRHRELPAPASGR
ncbi:MAG: AAA family ATPase [Pyrinomonadaceae bacterium]